MSDQVPNNPDLDLLIPCKPCGTNGSEPCDDNCNVTVQPNKPPPIPENPPVESECTVSLSAAQPNKPADQTVQPNKPEITDGLDELCNCINRPGPHKRRKFVGVPSPKAKEVHNIP